jgi:hypothetical protein
MLDHSWRSLAGFKSAYRKQAFKGNACAPQKIIGVNYFLERRLPGTIALTRAKPTGAAFRPAVADLESRSTACDFPLYFLRPESRKRLENSHANHAQLADYRVPYLSSDLSRIRHSRQDSPAGSASGSDQHVFQWTEK